MNWTWPMGIDGQNIVGYYRDSSGNDHGFLYTLQPPVADSDVDGVPDDEDECPDTPDNVFVDPIGCSIYQYCPPDGEWKNHGQFVSCVAHIAEGWLEWDLITEEEKDALVSEAAQSDVGKKK